jgi:hypothetical protein
LQVDGCNWGYFPVESAVSYSNDVAIIASAYDFIALPSSFYDQVEEQLIRFGFTCDLNIATGDIDCGIMGSCDFYAGFLPNLELKFLNDQYESFTITIDPKFYLLTLGTTDLECLVLLTETKETASFVLGGPFFRAYTIALNFNETEVYIYKNASAISPIDPVSPDVDSGLYLEELLSIDSNMIYTGTVFVGADFQTSDMILYDTGARMSAFPSTDSNVGWLDPSDPYAGIEVEPTYTFDLTVMAYTVSCEMAYSNICHSYIIPDTEDLCAYMGYCLTGDDNWPNQYLGMVGLGKWDVNDTESSYIMQMYLENGLKPEINIDMNF